MLFMSETEKGLDAHERSGMPVPKAQIFNATFLMKAPQAARPKGTALEIPAGCHGRHDISKHGKQHISTVPHDTEQCLSDFKAAASIRRALGMGELLDVFHEGHQEGLECA